MGTVLTLSGLLAATLITVCVVPQVVSVIRERDVGGISVTAASLATVSCVAWTAYALAVGMMLPALSSALGAFMWGVIAAAAAVKNQSRPSKWVALWGAVVAATWVAGGVTLLGLVLLAEALTNTAPQAVRARTEVQGVSLPTYLMMTTGALSWVVYGVVASDLPLSASSALKAAVSIYIVVLVMRGRSATSPIASSAEDGTVART